MHYPPFLLAWLDAPLHLRQSCRLPMLPWCRSAPVSSLAGCSLEQWEELSSMVKTIKHISKNNNIILLGKLYTLSDPLFWNHTVNFTKFLFWHSNGWPNQIDQLFTWYKNNHFFVQLVANQITRSGGTKWFCYNVNFFSWNILWSACMKCSHFKFGYP